jgi:hypothetical protein
VIQQPPDTILPQPEIRFLAGDYGLVLRPFEIEIPSLTARVRIREGFWFDGASKPAWLWNIPFCGTPWDADSLPAAVTHDILCATRAMPRQRADLVFFELLRANGVCNARAWTFYQAVRAGDLVGIGHPTEEQVAWARHFLSMQATDETCDTQLAAWYMAGKANVEVAA